jgi:arsenate-mycothiol transferase
MRKAVSDTVAVDSAGSKPGDQINQLSAEVLLEVSIDITDQTPKQLTADLIHAADLVVVLGANAQVRSVDGTPVELWDTDEPSERASTGSNGYASCEMTLRGV